MAEIFAVGEFVALEGDVASLPTRLRIIDPQPVGSLQLTGSDACVELSCPDEIALGRARAVEALRMGFRVAQKRWAEATVVVRSRVATSDDVRADGFSEEGDGDFVRSPGPLMLVAEKAATTYGAYQHVLDVHWNFVPAEVPAYEPLLAEPRLRILDVGCGVGKNARVLSRHGHEVAAVDASVWAVERGSVFMPDVHALVASAADLPFESASFDVVLDIGCLHCMRTDERPAAVGEMARVLTPGGRLFSRLFKPRSPDWVDRQPFQASTFGLTAAEVRELLSSHFSDLLWWREDPDMHYVRAVATNGAP